ncbi:choice-of-anchor B family protein [Marinirhabdus gelatinilytica]|uniref:Choice-of-anchor B domain-containing protein n=1 Tax=Marinirhabdus gelatinilytica TaxID=1703343 RepID=A0A370QKB4_9FLAO|nr:choice-of-anchor B family protein [Marinirhabdus gelatinilytica]RDK88776.1 choice-of-anchor B domain-containing protein [Marinirhabdus gelatinilytica]
MKKLLLALLFVGTLSFAQTPCENGMAGSFPCEDYELLSNIPLSTFDANSSSDSWGWTDPQDGKEYAIIGLRNGSGYVDISDPLNPIYLGKLVSPMLDEFWGNWHDVKVYNNHAYIVSEISGHGMQIFDLTKLRDVTNPPVQFQDDGVYNFAGGSAHNIAINEESGYAYLVGGNDYNGGPYFVNIQDPVNPIDEGGYSGDGYTHDAQIVNYTGPDPDHQGKEIFVGSNEDRVVFLDVSNKANPQNISSISYSNVEYTHQGWFTEDQRYFVVTDELDEVFNGNDLRLIIIDATDLDNPVEHMQYIGETTATDHNVYVKGDKIYIAAYSGGLRVLDISDIDNKNITEIGFFDTWPADDNASASIGDPGAWNVYPFFESGNLIISNFSDNGGLFVVRESGTLSVSENELQEITVSPNPSNGIVTFTSANSEIESIMLYDITGKELQGFEELSGLTTQIDISTLASGMYVARINGTTSVRLLKK